MDIFPTKIIILFLIINCASNENITKSVVKRTRKPLTTSSSNVSRTRKTRTKTTTELTTTTNMPPEEFRKLYPTVMSVEKVVKQAIQTFSVRQTKAKFQENLNDLMDLVNKLTLTDVYLTAEYVESLETGDLMGNPISYMPVYQDKNVSVSVFILQKWSVLPLHDHPLMHGILKVLYGAIKLQSYTVTDTRHIRHKDYNSENFCPNEYYYISKSELFYETMGTHSTRHPMELVTANDTCRLLTPFERNIHRVQSFGGTSAFFDILAPPYFSTFGNAKRECTFFNVMETKDPQKPMLSLSVFPPNYYTCDVEYKGPPINETIKNV